jgi:ferredoxin-nitrite reductase
VRHNLLISAVPDADHAAAAAAIAALGLATTASTIRGALVACTGKSGCKFALGNTKRHALELADHLEARVALDQPVTIHLTGCPHSCAQHLVADIGLLATKVAIGDDLAEGYDICVGGAGGAEPRIGREIFPAVPFADVPRQVERLLGAYLAHRASPAESFGAFANRHALDELKHLSESAVSQAA